MLKLDFRPVIARHPQKGPAFPCPHVFPFFKHALKLILHTGGNNFIMALIKCPNCQKEVSSMVIRCPFCGYNLSDTASAMQEGAYYDSNFFNHNTYKQESVPARSETRSETDFLFPEGYGISSGKPASTGNESTNRSRSSSPQGRQTSPRKRRQAAPGQRLLGYRTGNPLYMTISVFYHMAVCVGLLYAFSLSPQYLENGLLLFHIGRTITAGLMLLLPVIFLTDNRLRRRFPLLRSRKPFRVFLGFFAMYLPLFLVFLFCCLSCLSL